MFSRLAVFIGFRYCLSGRRDGFVSFISLFSFLAMTLGVMSLIVVLSVMNGFDREIKNRLLQIIPHATITHPQGIDNWQSQAESITSGSFQITEPLSLTPFIEGVAMLSSDAAFQGVSVQGVLPHDAVMASRFKGSSLGEHLSNLTPKGYGIVLGALLARNLGVEKGDTITLTLSELSVTPFGVFPRLKRVRVTGVFSVGAQVDAGLAFMHINDVATLLRMGSKVSGLRLYFEDPFKMPSLKLLQQYLKSNGGQSLQTWQQSMAQLFQAIRTEKIVVGLLLSVVVGVAAFNIIASLVLIVSEKRKDIAVLRSLGAMPETIVQIFRIQGGVFGISGVLCGVVTGCLLAANIGALLNWLESFFGFHVFDPALYFITKLPSHLMISDVLIVGGFAFVLSIFATLYPAWRASKVPPAEVLRYE